MIMTHPVNKYLLILLSALSLVACGDGGEPSHSEEKPVADSVMTLLKMKNNGQWYATIDCNVLSLDLYSDGLQFNEKGYIEGSGTNLYLSDVFVSLEDSLLTDGTYVLDTTNLEQTALPGINLDGAVAGAYLLLIEDSHIKSIILIKDGFFDVTHTGDSLFIDFNLTTSDDQSYHASYVGNRE